MAMKKAEAISLLAMVAIVIAPWFIAGLDIWGWLFTVIFGVVGIFEAYSSLKNGKTISQLFWKYRKEHPKTAYGILTCASIGWILLIIHLLS